MFLQPRHIPNIISFCRILLVGPILWAISKQNYALAALLFVIASMSDGLDGYLAKRNGWTSRLGGILDPLADKALLVGMFLVLGWVGQLPVWLVALVIGRDIVIVAGSLAYHWLVEPFQARPLYISKFNTVCQILLVCAVVLSHGVWPLPDWVTTGLIYLVALTTLLSGSAYVWLGCRGLIRKRKMA